MWIRFVFKLDEVGMRKKINVREILNGKGRDGIVIVVVLALNVI